ncbi:MAG: SGNH/GDSL hydrolase family protein [Acidobacteriota bacterium]
MKTGWAENGAPGAGLFSLAAGLLLFPLLALEAWRVRRRTPRLSEPPGPPAGLTKGAGIPRRLVVLGESPVAGIGLADHREGLAARCAAILNESNGEAVAWQALGKSGITAREAASELVPGLGSKRVDLLVIALGVNDAISLHSSGRFRRDMKSLLAAAVRETGGSPTIVAGIPPVKYFPALPQPLRFFLGLRAECLDAVLPEVVRSFENLRYVPTRFEGGRSLFAPDGFHPGSRGFEVWAERLAPVMEEMCGRKAPPGVR